MSHQSSSLHTGGSAAMAKEDSRTRATAAKVWSETLVPGVGGIGCVWGTEEREYR